MNPLQGKVLLVDDERSIRRSLSTSLSTLGFHIEEASHGEQAVLLIRSEHYDAALLDINMPGMGGIAACRSIRRLCPRLPILMLTVRDSESDKIAALDAGADDYVTKPFHIRELMARVRAAVRRSQLANTVAETETVITIGEIELDVDRHLVQKSGEAVHVTPKEFELLHCLMSHAGRPLTHAYLLSSVWGREYGNELEYLRTYIRQLRKKLENDPSRPDHLLTEATIGYRFSHGVHKTIEE